MNIVKEFVTGPGADGSVPRLLGYYTVCNLCGCRGPLAFSATAAAILAGNARWDVPSDMTPMGPAFCPACAKDLTEWGEEARKRHRPLTSVA